MAVGKIGIFGPQPLSDIVSCLKSFVIAPKRSRVAEEARDDCKAHSSLALGTVATSPATLGGSRGKNDSAGRLSLPEHKLVSRSRVRSHYLAMSSDIGGSTPIRDSTTSTATGGADNLISISVGRVR
jgi:hypothetical protein